MRDLLAEWAPVAYDAGLTPSEFRRSTFAEIQAVARAVYRRRCRAADTQAVMVAQLMFAGGNIRPGVTLEDLTRQLLGREWGTVPGEPMPERAEPNPDAFVEWLGLYVRAHGGKDLRAQSEEVSHGE